MSDMAKEACFLIDRLDDFEREYIDEKSERDWAGHVSPSVERLRKLVEGAQPTGDVEGLSEEDKKLIAKVHARLENNGRNPANNNEGIRVGGPLHLCEMLLAIIDRLSSRRVTQLPENVNVKGLVERAGAYESHTHVLGHARETKLILAMRDALVAADSRIAALTQEMADWQQAAGVEAGLRREFLARAEAAEARVAVLEKELKELAARSENFWAFLQGEHGVKLSSADEDDHNVHGFFAALRRAALSTGAGEEKR